MIRSHITSIRKRPSSSLTQFLQRRKKLSRRRRKSRGHFSRKEKRNRKN